MPRCNEALEHSKVPRPQLHAAYRPQGWGADELGSGWRRARVVRARQVKSVGLSHRTSLIRSTQVTSGRAGDNARIWVRRAAFKALRSSPPQMTGANRNRSTEGVGWPQQGESTQHLYQSPPAIYESVTDREH